MARVDEYLARIDDPTRPPLTDTHPHDAVLQGLLVHLAYSDGIVQGDEFALLRHVRPDLSDADLMAWANDVAAQGFDMASLAEALDTPEARWSGLRFAARMACLDGDVAGEERVELERLAEALALPPTAVIEAVAEVVATVKADTARVADALRHMFWDSLVPEREDLESDLAAVVPEGATLVCRVLLRDDTEVAGLFQEGLVARFDDGPAFVAWSAIEAYTRVPVPGAAFHLTADDTTHSIGDPRLRDLGKLLDAVYIQRAQP